MNTRDTHTPCELQAEHDDIPRVEAIDATRDGQPGVELISYVLGEDADDEPDVMDIVFLSTAGWQQLVELFALRHPAAAQRILTKALGWLGERGGQTV